MNELEKRLRELEHDWTRNDFDPRVLRDRMLDFARQAARLGAEIEREECVAIADWTLEGGGPMSPGECLKSYRDRGFSVLDVRARGGK
jgi:hypothetical protein